MVVSCRGASSDLLAHRATLSSELHVRSDETTHLQVFNSTTNLSMPSRRNVSKKDTRERFVGRQKVPQQNKKERNKDMHK